MDGIVQIEARTVYGNVLFYPANEKARHLAELTGKKTLDRRDFNLIRHLGFKVELVQKEVAL